MRASLPLPRGAGAPLDPGRRALGHAGTVEAVDERSTTALWSNDSLARRQLSAPEVFSSYVAVGDLDGYLHLLSQVDGRFVGRERIDSDGLRARPLVVGDTIYVYGNSGKLEALTIK